MKSTLRKLLVGSLVLSTMFVNTAIPTWAAKSETPDISPWALNVINEGEHYGIYPIEWYYEDFKDGISEARVKVLLQETKDKLSALKLEKNADFKPLSVKQATTREGVLIALYNELAQYKMPATLELEGMEPIAFMKQNKIIVGDKTGFQLERVCTTEQAAIFATKLIELAYHENAAGGEGFLWKATNGDTTVYMLGSIHIADPSIYPMDKGLLKAYESSQELLVEANLFDQQGGMAYMRENSVYADKTTLKDVVSPETYEKVQKAFAKFNMTEAQYGKLKPWVASSTLSVLEMSNSSSAADAGSASNLGIDMYFMTKALLEQKPIVELEGLKFQTDMFNNLSMKTQEEQLAAAADAVLGSGAEQSGESETILNTWLNQWKEGDVAGFQKSYEAASVDANDEFNKMLFGERDKNMAQKISAILDKKENKIYFVVVGSGHLALKDSTVDILKEKGYKVELVDVDQIIIQK